MTERRQRQTKARSSRERKQRVHIHLDKAVRIAIEKAAKRRQMTRAAFIAEAANAAALAELSKG